MTRVYLAAACTIVGVLCAGRLPAVGGAGFVLASLLLVLMVIRGDLREFAAAARTPVNLRVYTATTLFIAAVALALGVSLWVD